jgi:NADH-quinone oxidoreductase subunit C
MSDISVSKKFNRLSETGVEQRKADLNIQELALDALQQLLGDKIKDVARMRGDITVTIGPDELLAAAEALRSNSALEFVHLSSITGVDYSRFDFPESWGDIRFGVVYNLFSYEKSANFALRVVVSEEEPVVPSLFHIWHGADWQEREVYDLLGVSFEGHPDLRRLFLYDDFEGEYPLRKDYPLKGKGERDKSWLPMQKQARVEESK